MSNLFSRDFQQGAIPEFPFASKTGRNHQMSPGGNRNFPYSNNRLPLAFFFREGYSANLNSFAAPNNNDLGVLLNGTYQYLAYGPLNGVDFPIAPAGISYPIVAGLPWTVVRNARNAHTNGAYFFNASASWYYNENIPINAGRYFLNYDSGILPTFTSPTNPSTIQVFASEMGATSGGILLATLTSGGTSVSVKVFDSKQAFGNVQWTVLYRVQNAGPGFNIITGTDGGLYPDPNGPQPDAAQLTIAGTKIGP